MDANDLVLPSMTAEEKETLAVKSKEEGNLYFWEEKFDKAIEAYNNALQVTSSSQLRHKVRINLCHSFYTMNTNNKCIKQA